MLGLLALTGCSEPDESDAREWYGKLRPTVQATAADIRAAVKRRPDLTAPAPKDCSGLPPETFVPCHEREYRTRTKRNAAARDLDRTDLPPLLDRRGVVGVKLRHSVPGRPNQFLGDIGLTPGGHSLRVNAEKGISIDDKRVGWGLYQTAYARKGVQQGDGEARPGIEVAWQFREGGITVDAAVWVLVDHETTPAWRAGLR